MEEESGGGGQQNSWISEGDQQPQGGPQAPEGVSSNQSTAVDIDPFRLIDHFLVFALTLFYSDGDRKLKKYILLMRITNMVTTILMCLAAVLVLVSNPEVSTAILALYILFVFFFDWIFFLFNTSC